MSLLFFSFSGALEKTLLILNSMAILNEKRFLKKCKINRWLG